MGCNGFTYFATYANNTAIDNTVFAFNPLTRDFTISTSDTAKIGIYNILVTGYIFDPNKK